jgi:gamma-glutamylcyclotransferase (GGCT)/AIG2-like uncharacterized protein YtfP
LNTVFVYGLLKRGFSLHHVVAPFVVRSMPAVARGRLYDAGVPAARFDEDGEVEGFVLWLRRTHDALRVLDDLEDEGDMYERIVVSVATATGVVDAYAYHYLLPVEQGRFAGRSWNG